MRAKATGQDEKTPTTLARCLRAPKGGSGQAYPATRYRSKGEVWHLGPYCWSHHRHDRRFCVRGVDNYGHCQNHVQGGGLGESGSDCSSALAQALQLPHGLWARVLQSRVWIRTEVDMPTHDLCVPNNFTQCQTTLSPAKEMGRP